jgi:GLPGLI family protein
MGKEFCKGSLVNYQWKLEGETRVIGGYNCFKATTVRPAKTDFRNFRPKKEDPAAAKSAEGEKKTNFMDNLEMPDVTITAWYPEIPVNQGPENYWDCQV